MISRKGKFPYSAYSLIFLLTITRSGRLAEIRRSVYISKSCRILCVLFARTDYMLCIYHLFVWSNLNFLHNSKWITFAAQSCLVWYYFCTNMLYSLIMWLIVSSTITKLVSAILLRLIYSCFDIIVSYGVVYFTPREFLPQFLLMVFHKFE